MTLTRKQQLFVDYYLQSFNSTKSARLAGYKDTNAKQQGWQLRREPEIAKAIEEKLTEVHMSADEALKLLAEIARGDIADVLNDDLEQVDAKKAKKNQKTNLIKSITTTTNRLGKKHKVEMYSRLDAVDKVLRVHGKFNDKLSVNGGAGELDKPLVLPADAIASSFLNAYRDIIQKKHTEYLFYGGRGSTKSTFVSLAMVYLLVNNPTWHGLAMRQVADTLRISTYGQIEWSINALGLSDLFKLTTSPMEITYLPTGQKIYFRGADDPMKIKSIRPPFGSIALLWFEELPEFHGDEVVRNITQSAIRGTDTAYIFKSYNPPRTSGNWVNKYCLIPKESQYQHKSDYLSVPVEWLGQVFIDEAEHLKSVNLAAYEHEYLGEVNGLGDMVFENLEIRKITDEEIFGKPDGFKHFEGGFDNILHGLDYGYFPHPAHYSRVHYDATRHILYIFGEIRKWKTSNKEMYDALVEYGYENNDLLICDSEDPKSIGDYRAYGANARGAEKGAGSVNYSMKWLQSLLKIVIDPVRCPYSVEEFTDYAYERTKDDEIIEAYPRENDDAIAAVRYATNWVWRRRGE